MGLARLAKVAVIGSGEAYPIAEDALSALKVMEVSRIVREDAHFVIEGWVTEAWVEELADILDLGSDGAVFVARDGSAPPALVESPTLLDNPKAARPFEYLTRLFALPGRSEYDPTLATFLILPLFIGFIIGDVAHGLMLMAAGGWIRWRYRAPMPRLAATILLTGGAWGIVLGAFVFGEALSFPFAPPPFGRPLLDKVGDVETLLVVSLLIGVAHVALGLGIGFVYERRRAGLRAAVLRKLSWLILEIGVVVLAIGILGLVAEPFRLAGVGLIGLAVVLLSLGGGLVDVLEVPSFLSNILSYVRLGALGVADALFGATINEEVLRAADAGGLPGLALGWLALLLLHTMLVMLAVFFASLHALRLHYVEFYTKFYRLDQMGRTRPFHPAPPPPAPSA